MRQFYHSQCYVFLYSNIYAIAGVAADCDSDYEASAIGYLSTPTHDFASPNTDGSDLHESLSSSSISQDSMEPEEDNASTVSNLSDLSGISELSGSELKDCISWLNIVLLLNCTSSNY